MEARNNLGTRLAKGIPLQLLLGLKVTTWAEEYCSYHMGQPKSELVTTSAKVPTWAGTQRQQKPHIKIK